MLTIQLHKAIRAEALVGHALLAGIVNFAAGEVITRIRYTPHTPHIRLIRLIHGVQFGLRVEQRLLVSCRLNDGSNA